MVDKYGKNSMYVNHKKKCHLNNYIAAKFVLFDKVKNQIFQSNNSIKCCSLANVLVAN